MKNSVNILVFMSGA